MNPSVKMFLLFCLVVLTYAQVEITRNGDEFIYKSGNEQYSCKIGEKFKVANKEGPALPCQCGACLKTGGCSGEGSCLIDGICNKNWEKYHGDQQKCLNDGGAPCDLCPQIYSPGQDEDFEDDLDENEEYSVSEPEETRDLNEEELALIYREVTKAFREEGMHEAAESTEREWQEIQSSADRRRLASSTSPVGKMAACRGLTAKGPKAQKCYSAFSNIVNKFIQHEGNVAMEICSKPDNKRQRSRVGCCGGYQLPFAASFSGSWSMCYDGPRHGMFAGCCGGCTKSWDQYCYADSGKCTDNDGVDVCPPDKTTCAKWSIIPAVAFFTSADLCASDTTTCAMEIATLGMNIVDIIANVALMCFTGGAGNVLKAGVKAGSKALLAAGKNMGRQMLAKTISTAFRNGVKKAIWANVKSNLRRHFKKMKKELGKYVLEEMTAIAAAKAADDEAKAGIDIGEVAWNVAEIVDPTGVSTLVRYLVDGQEQCKYPDGPTDQELSALNAVFEESDNWNAHCGNIPHGAFESRKRYRTNVVYSGVGHLSWTCANQIETQKRSCHHGQLTDWSGEATHTSCTTKVRHYRKMDCKQNCPSGWKHFETTNHGCCASFWSCGGNMKGCEKYTATYGRTFDVDAVLCDKRDSDDGMWYQPSLPGVQRDILPGCNSDSMTEICTKRCREKCESKVDCFFFSYFWNGACFYAGKDAMLQYTPSNPTVANGRVRCPEPKESSGHESFATAQSVISNPTEFSMLHGFALLGLIFIMFSSYKHCSKARVYVHVPNGAEQQEI